MMPPSGRDTAPPMRAIYDRHDYAAAIDQLKGLGHDDNANVANLIGYSYRKLGDYKLSQVWYERALKTDPNHVLTWQYYGLWQIEQGNREQAQYHLNRIGAICGTDCARVQVAGRRARKPARHRTGLLKQPRIARRLPRKRPMSGVEQQASRLWRRLRLAG